MDNIFIDTDVLIDFLDDREPFSEHSYEVFVLAELKKINLYTTALTLSNAYYVLSKFISHNSLVEKFLKLLKLVDIIPTTKKSVFKSLLSNFNDLEDAFQNFSAEEFHNINILMTRNIKDFRKSNLIIQTPEQYLLSR